MAHKQGEAHIRLNRELLASEAYLSLPDAALRLLVDLRYLMTSYNNGILSVTLSVLKHRGWNSSDKLARAKRELEQRGIIVCTKPMRRNARHEPSRYAFTDAPIPAHPAHGIAGRGRSDSYRQWTRKSALRQTESTLSVSRKASVPSDGKRGSKTAPSDGKRENADMSSSVSDITQFSEKTVRFPPHGNKVRSNAIRTAATTAACTTEQLDTVAMTDADYRAALAAASDERERARLRYHRRTRGRAAIAHEDS